MKTVIRCTIFGLFYVFCACSKNDSNNIRQFLWIGKERVTCQGFIQQTCYLTQTNTNMDGNWELFYDAIRGFDELYEEGFIYKIEVERTTIVNPPADGSAYAYRLIRIISKEK